MQSRIWMVILLVLLAPLPLGAWALANTLIASWSKATSSTESETTLVAGSPRVRERSGMVRIAAGRTMMGDSHSVHADRQPAHEIWLDPFWLDSRLVTNEQFANFIAATGYETTAEQRGASLVFDRERGQWLEVQNADWQAPQGPLSTLADRETLPVVHVSWHDAMAYARWAGKRLATEAEYELAARGGLIDHCYAWPGDTSADDPQANFWQGRFPHEDLGLDNYRGLSPVGSFPPNRFGLYDITGNVWCWCADWYAADYYFASPRQNPAGPTAGQARVLRGGSWLSTGGANGELAVSARGHAPPHHTASNVGFRCAVDILPIEVAVKPKSTR